MKIARYLVVALLMSGVGVKAKVAQADDIGTERPTQEQSLLVRAFVGAAFVNNNCAGFKANSANLIALLAKQGLEPKDIYIRFGEYAATFNSIIVRDYDQHPAEFCSFLVQMYGPGGRMPDLVEQR